ncbi:hypothetical protein RYX36_033235 [Vicia faba]
MMLLFSFVTYHTIITVDSFNTILISSYTLPSPLFSSHIPVPLTPLLPSPTLPSPPVFIHFSAGFKARHLLVTFKQLLPIMPMFHPGKERQPLSLIHKSDAGLTVQADLGPDNISRIEPNSSSVAANSSHQAASHGLVCLSDDDD